jgi:DNA polymerase elongation subunit (family B)
VKIMLWDVENTANVADVWGYYEQNVVHVRKPYEILCISYKWLGQKNVKTLSRKQFKDKTDKTLLKAFSKVLAKADIIVAHNGDKTDIRKVNARLAKHSLPPAITGRSEDTLKLARKHFLFNGNGLGDLATFLGVGKKLKTSGYEMWLGCEEGADVSWTEMIKYNKQDVVLLEGVFNKLKPWLGKVYTPRAKDRAAIREGK